MYAGATYQGGVAHVDGAVYVEGLATGVLPAATAIPVKGASPLPAKFLNADGAIYVRYV